MSAFRIAPILLTISGLVVAGPSVAQDPGSSELRYVVGPDGNDVRYKVREQLARIPFPSDAVGGTRRIQGQIVFDSNGGIVRDESRFEVNLASLQSDQERRDNYLRRNTLRTDSFPTMVLIPTEVRGLPFPLPDAGEHTFELVGAVTLRGVTRPTVWNVTARFEQGDVRGTAETSFTFGHFDLPIPRVASVLSVVDEIRLEYDFRFVAVPSP